jgi:hypothetical protein
MTESAELWFTILFVIDIAIRFTVWPPRPKRFFESKKNNFDMFLALATLIIQIPAIRDSHAYVYLSIFQVMRIYRPIIYIESLRVLIVSLYLPDSRNYENCARIIVFTLPISLSSL